MKTHCEEEMAALSILKGTGVNIVEAALVAKVVLEVGGARHCASETTGLRALKRCKKIIELGTEELKRQEKTLTFEKAVAAALDARKERRAGTLCDFWYITRRFMKRCRGLAKRWGRAITGQERSDYIDTAFDTPSQRVKARRVLSGGVRHSCKARVVQ